MVKKLAKTTSTNKQLKMKPNATEKLMRKKKVKTDDEFVEMAEVTILPQVMPEVELTYGALNNKVLIIDDDHFSRSVYESELRQQNITSISAIDGLSGLELARNERPSIILLEMVLPKMNGFELIKQLRKSKELKGVTIIVGSILGQSDDIVEAIKTGADKYLSKNDYSAKQIIMVVVNLMAAKL